MGEKLGAGWSPNQQPRSYDTGPGLGALQFSPIQCPIPGEQVGEYNTPQSKSQENWENSMQIRFN